MKKFVCFVLAFALVCTLLSFAGAESEEKVVIRILSSQQTENPEGSIEKSISDAYTALHPNVTFEYISAKSNEYIKKLQAMGTAGDMADMFQNSSNNLPTTVDLDLCFDLTGLFDAAYLDGLQPQMREEASYGGELLFMPTQSLPMALLYRDDWFQEEGLQPPETWDDFIACAQALTKDTDGDGVIDRYGFAMIATKDSSAGTRFLPILRSFGCREVYFEDGKWKTEVGSDAFKLACQTFADLDVKYHVVQPGSIETSYSEAANLLVANKAAMMITGSNALGTIYAQNPDLKGKLATCAIPAYTTHTSRLGTLGYSIYKGSEKNNALKWTEISYRVPVRTEYYGNLILQEKDMKGFVDGIESAYAWPQFLGIAKTYEIIGSVYQALITGSMDIDTASEQARVAMEELIESYE